MKGSAAEHFETLYRRVWGALNRPDAPDLSQHERQLLHHVPADGAVSLTWLAEHLALPKSTASMVVKSLGRRGFVERARDPADERRLAIVLTERGKARVGEDTVLDPEALKVALAKLSPPVRAGLLDGMEQLAAAAEAVAGKKEGGAWHTTAG
ncbi:MAG: winged helix-turn-helix transcriptional regulator [Actinobacteria bacterium]|nr:MAG: winged helix-turn-helix transcriptional regulator [Actinomycetota bacterium]